MNYFQEVERIRIARIARRRTQWEVAEALGRTQEWLSQVENGKIRTDDLTMGRLREMLRPEEILRA